MDATDEAEVKRHQDIWNGFARFLFWSTIHVVVILALMALFLL